MTSATTVIAATTRSVSSWVSLLVTTGVVGAVLVAVGVVDMGCVCVGVVVSGGGLVVGVGDSVMVSVVNSLTVLVGVTTVVGWTGVVGVIVGVVVGVVVAGDGGAIASRSVYRILVSPVKIMYSVPSPTL